jgi:PRTRC genetic system ThiF family protein
MHSYSLNSSRELRVLIIGAGGTGSAIFLALPYLHQAMKAWGHPGLDVTIMDADTVSETNCVRQPFALTDVGQNKAIVLTNRVNLFWGTDWSASPARFSAKAMHDDLYGFRGQGFDLVIGCVDSKASRKQIEEYAAKASVSYWLDLGNNASSGQFVLGQPKNAVNAKLKARLFTAAELYPEIVDTTTPESDLPSCSAIEALERQEPFINQTLAMQALAMLTQLLRYGKTSYQGAFFNAKSGTTTPIPVVAAAPKARRRK